MTNSNWNTPSSKDSDRNDVSFTAMALLCRWRFFNLRATHTTTSSFGWSTSLSMTNLLFAMTAVSTKTHTACNLILFIFFKFHFTTAKMADDFHFWPCLTNQVFWYYFTLGKYPKVICVAVHLQIKCTRCQRTVSSSEGKRKQYVIW